MLCIARFPKLVVLLSEPIILLLSRLLLPALLLNFTLQLPYLLYLLQILLIQLCDLLGEFFDLLFE